MSKQVFEFTDLEVLQILADKLYTEGKLNAGNTSGVIESEGKRGFGERGFVIRVKIEQSSKPKINQIKEG